MSVLSRFRTRRTLGNHHLLILRRRRWRARVIMPLSSSISRPGPPPCYLMPPLGFRNLKLVRNISGSVYSGLFSGVWRTGAPAQKAVKLDRLTQHHLHHQQEEAGKRLLMEAWRLTAVVMRNGYLTRVITAGLAAGHRRKRRRSWRLHVVQDQFTTQKKLNVCALILLAHFVFHFKELRPQLAGNRIPHHRWHLRAATSNRFCLYCLLLLLSSFLYNY